MSTPDVSHRNSRGRNSTDSSSISTSGSSSGVPETAEPKISARPASSVHDPDLENGADDIVQRKEFKPRHITMMSFGASIGIGVLYQSSSAFHFAGPIPFVLSYLLLGTVCYSVLHSLGEMSAFLPLPGAWFTMASRTLSPSLGFGFGWIYWFTYLVAFPAKLVAGASLMRFWLSKSQVNPAVWITTFLVFPIAFNMFNVRKYGEIEFWLTTIKITAFIGIILLGLLLPMAASTATPQYGTASDFSLIPCLNASTDNCVSPAGFYYWREDGWKEFLTTGSLGRLAAFWFCCCQAAFSYIGTEIIGITASEAEAPRTTIPAAVRRVSARLWIYYVGASFVLGLNLSPDDPRLVWYITNPAQSYEGPYSLMLQRAGLPALAQVLNVVALIACLSVANANLYETSRALYALASKEQAPQVFLRLSRYDVPWVGVLLSAGSGTLAYLTLGKVTSNSIFDFLTGMVTTGGLIGWCAICCTYLRFRRAYLAQNVVPQFTSPLQPFLAWWGLSWSLFLTVFQGFIVFTRHNPYWSVVAKGWGFSLGPYFYPAVFLALIAFWMARTRYVTGSWSLEIKPLSQVDLMTGQAAEPLDSTNKSTWKTKLEGALKVL